MLKPVKVLVVGSGGREHALAWKLAQDEAVTQLYAYPGNPGIAQVAECLPAGQLPDIYSPAALLRIAEEFAIDLTVIGPEAPLVAGAVDTFRAAGRRIIGPTQENARLEGSKAYAKRFFAVHHIPTAAFSTITSVHEAKSALDRCHFPVVVKADGLASGKGVIIAHNRAEADLAVQTLGPNLVLEEFLSGEEVSFIVLSDGRDALVLEPCQDHKAAYDGDHGPNTGGMGAYCDSRILSSQQREQILNTIIRPTIAATGFTGFLFAGLIMTEQGPKLLEYNVRLGDPETQAILPRMAGGLAQVLLASLEHKLGSTQVSWLNDPSVCVVMAAQGYPQRPRTGDVIHGIDAAEATGAHVFHAGTALGRQGLETAGGRVLGITHSGRDLRSAIANSYRAVERISFAGQHYRKDIAQKGLSRWPATSLQ